MIAYCNRTLLVSPIFYCLITNEKDFHKELRSLKIPVSKWPSFMPENANACVSYFRDKQVCIVRIQENLKEDPVKIASLLVHEAVHVWQYIRDQLGEEEPGDEQEAYAIQRISQSLLESYAKSLEKK